jgi:protein TonB
MPRDLFAAPSMTTVRSARRRLTLVCSTIAHAVVLGLIVIVPLVTAVSLPDLTSHLYAFDVMPVAPPAMPIPPVRAVRPLAPPPSSSDVTPLEAPPTISPERDLPARASHEGLRLNVASGDIFGQPAGVDTGLPLLGAPPKASAPLPIGGDIRPPARVFNVDPVYPAIAQAARVEGTVILEATIDERGNVINTRVLRSVPLLDRAAIDAVSRWRYSPTRLNGVAVLVVMTVTVTFSMR